MATRKRPQAISHEELQAALRKFQKRGGMIQKLPDQKTVANSGVTLRDGLPETDVLASH
jgi:hypothetical protein